MNYFVLILFICIIKLTKTLITIPLKEPITIISIVDDSSAYSALLKCYSIIKSHQITKSYYLSFKFLLIDNNNNNNNKLILNWNNIIKKLFPELIYEAKSWIQPKTFPRLRNSKFETSVIFARFYLPIIFKDVDRYIYIDNDIIVNADILELYKYPLFIRDYDDIEESLSGIGKIQQSKVEERLFKEVFQDQRLPLYDRYRKNEIHDRNSLLNSYNKKKEIFMKSLKYSIVGFVFDRAYFNKEYIHNHFNQSHPLVISAMKVRELDIFFNGGVALINSKQWRLNNLTELAEKIIIENINGEIYSTSAGDQGTFWLLLQHEITYLPHKWNMRRLPIRTVGLLDKNIKGIVHFAGIVHGKLENLCINPLLYPVLLNSALPLFLSISYSFHLLQLSTSDIDSDFNSSNYWSVPSVCLSAITLLINHCKEENITINYNGGLGKFNWPPF